MLKILFPSFVAVIVPEQSTAKMTVTGFVEVLNFIQEDQNGSPMRRPMKSSGDIGNEDWKYTVAFSLPFSLPLSSS